MKVFFYLILKILLISFAESYDRLINLAAVVSDPSSNPMLNPNYILSLNHDNQQSCCIRGFETLKNKINEYGGIPIGTNGDKLFMNFSYFNIGTVPAFYASNNTKALTKITSGLYGDYSVFLPSRFVSVAGTGSFASYCEKNKNCINLSTQSVNRADFVCTATNPLNPNSIPSDCLTSNKKNNQRRNEYTFNGAQATTNLHSSFLSFCKVKGFKTAIFFQYNNTANPSVNVFLPPLLQNNLELKETITYPVFTATGGPLTQGFSIDPNLITKFAKRAKEINADIAAFLCLATHWRVCYDLIKAFKAVDYSPRIAHIAGGALEIIQQNYDPDFSFISGTVPWSQYADGDTYRFSSGIGNIDLWPPNSSYGSPFMYFQDEQRYYPSVNTACGIISSICTHAVQTYLKGFEYTNNINSSTDDIKLGMSRINQGGIIGSLGFDNFGTLVPTERLLYQLVDDTVLSTPEAPAGKFIFYYPNSIRGAQEFINPPTWNQRGSTADFTLNYSFSILGCIILVLGNIFTSMVIELAIQAYIKYQFEINKSSFISLLISSATHGFTTHSFFVCTIYSKTFTNLYPGFDLVTVKLTDYIYTLILSWIISLCTFILMLKESNKKNYLIVKSIKKTSNNMNSKGSGKPETERSAFELTNIAEEETANNKILREIKLILISYLQSGMIILFYFVLLNSIVASVNLQINSLFTIYCFLTAIFSVLTLRAFFHLKKNKFRYVFSVILCVGSNLPILFGGLLTTTNYQKNKNIKLSELNPSILIVTSISISSASIILSVIYNIIKLRLSTSALDSFLTTEKKKTKVMELVINHINRKNTLFKLTTQLIHGHRPIINLGNPLWIEFVLFVSSQETTEPTKKIEPSANAQEMTKFDLPHQVSQNNPPNEIKVNNNPQNKSIDIKTATIDHKSKKGEILTMVQLDKMLNDVIENDLTLEIFKDYCESNKNSENISFILLVKYLKNRKAKSNDHFIDYIYKNYIMENSSQEINVQGNEKTTIINNYNRGNKNSDMFDAIIPEIIRLVRLNDFTKFAESDNYKIHCVTILDFCKKFNVDFAYNQGLIEKLNSHGIFFK